MLCVQFICIAFFDGRRSRAQEGEESDAQCCELFRGAVEEAVMQGIAACSGVAWRKLTGAQEMASHFSYTVGRREDLEKEY
jgi:hypothetical protein